MRTLTHGAAFIALTLTLASCTPPTSVESRPTSLALCTSQHPNPQCESATPRTDTSPLGFTYQHYDQHGQPIRWEHCSTVPYRINPDGATPEHLQAIHAAFAETSSHTGIAFRYAGDTTTTRPWGQHPRPNSTPTTEPADGSADTVATTGGVDITFADADTIPALAGSVVALANTAWRAAANRDEPGRITAASIVFDTETSITDITGPGSFATIALHEIGHAVNLGHVNEPDALMRTHLNRDLAAEYPQPEQAALRLLYEPNNCL